MSDAVVMNVIMGSVILLMLGAGLRIDIRQILDVFKRIRLVGLGIAANFIIVPALIYIGILWLPLSAEIKIGIMLMAAAPVAPMAPAPFVVLAKGDLPYSVGLMMIVAVLSIFLTPLILSLSLPASAAGLEIDPIEIVKILLTVQLIPICIGIAVRHFKGGWAEGLLKFIPRIGQIGLVIGLVILLSKQASQMLSIGLMSYLVMFLFTVVSLVVGHYISAGETAERRRALAVATAVRNIPLAFLIATVNFPGKVVGPVALVFSVFNMVLAVVYGKLLAGRQTQSL